MTFLIGALGVLAAFGLVIFVHEFGHFIVAKKSGVKVERFSFGLGPELVGFQWGETRYCLAWIPLGGEVRMAGEMEPGEAPEAPRDPRDFFAQPWHRRVLIVAAGPVMNYVLSFALFSLVAFVWGEPRVSPEPVVGEVVENYPAAAAGIRPGDRFLSVAGAPVSLWKDLADRIHASPDKPVPVEIGRGGETLSLQVTPRRDPASGRGLIGISPSTIHARVGFFQSLDRGWRQCLGWSMYTLRYLGEKIVRREKPDLAGPIGIATVVAKAAKAGAQDFLFLVSLISVGIGLFNFFPIPLLDGGHLAFYLWEGVFRRPASKKMVQAANMVGLSVLLGILIFATFSDIQRMRAPADAAAKASPRP